MLRIVFCALFSLSALFFSCRGSNRIYAEGPITRQERTLGEFTRIYIEDGLDVVFAVGSTNVMQLEAQASVMPYIESKIRNHALHISIKSGTIFGGSANIKLHVIGNNIGAINVSGGGSAECANNIDRESFEVRCSDGGSVSLLGCAGRVDVECSGGGRVGSFDFTCANNLKLKISGGGKAEFTLMGRANVVLSGGSSFTYRGDGTIESSKLSGGSAVQKE